MSKKNVILRDHYIYGSGGHLRLFTRAKGTVVGSRDGARVAWRDEVIVQWEGAPEYNSHYAAEMWADTPTNRKRAHVAFAVRLARANG